MSNPRQATSVVIKTLISPFLSCASRRKSKKDKLREAAAREAQNA